MAALSEHSNVYNTALLVVKQKGFQIWYDPATEDYCAERHGWDFRSRTPCGLLGLIAIFEARAPAEYAEYWWRVGGPQVYGTLPPAPSSSYPEMPLPAPFLGNDP